MYQLIINLIYCFSFGALFYDVHNQTSAAAIAIALHMAEVARRKTHKSERKQNSCGGCHMVLFLSLPGAE